MQAWADLVANANSTDAATGAAVEGDLADLDEVTLFKRFPDDAAAVEEALLRFAGMAHPAARAMEVLLTRPPPSTGKSFLDHEKDLDYDCAMVLDDDEARDEKDCDEQGDDAEFKLCDEEPLLG